MPAAEPVAFRLGEAVDPPAREPLIVPEAEPLGVVLLLQLDEGVAVSQGESVSVGRAVEVACVPEGSGERLPELEREALMQLLLVGEARALRERLMEAEGEGVLEGLLAGVRLAFPDTLGLRGLREGEEEVEVEVVEVLLARGEALGAPEALAPPRELEADRVLDALGVSQEALLMGEEEVHSELLCSAEALLLPLAPPQALGLGRGEREGHWLGVLLVARDGEVRGLGVSLLVSVAMPGGEGVPLGVGSRGEGVGEAQPVGVKEGVEDRDRLDVTVPPCRDALAVSVAAGRLWEAPKEGEAQGVADCVTDEEGEREAEGEDELLRVAVP